MKLQKEEHTVLLLLIIATIATGIIYLAASSASMMPSVSAGDQVSVEGTLLHKETTYTGSHLLLVVKTAEGPRTVFVPASADCYSVAKKAEPGCRLCVTGKEQEYKGEKEIVASAMAIK